ncbi:MAG TPA: hypothetical protein VFX37_10785 [Pseudolabrys sp.]|nr:hypothetical protein [Pseudolabrys sp.]
MKFGIPWGTKGNQAETLETAGNATLRHNADDDALTNAMAHPSIVPDLGDSTRPSRHPRDLGRLGGMTARFDIDKAIAEISARRSKLDAEPMMPAAASTPDLSGLEIQLRKITDQIETLRRPAIEEAINALRGEIQDIGRLLAEKTVRTFEPQSGGGDTTSGKISAELPQDLRNVRQTEGWPEIKEAMSSLASKIDLAVVQSDPVALQRVESSIASLRETTNRLASNETVTRLADCLHALAQKLETTHGGAATNADGGVAVKHLEDRIAKLVERLDAADTKFNHLEAVERGLADLLVHIDAIRAERGDRLHADRSSGAADAVGKAPLTPKQAAADVATRIAASEAAIRGIKPNVSAESSERSNFIVAARRAAHAAAQEPAVRARPAERDKTQPVDRSKFTHRMKSILIAASIVAIVIGSLQIAAKVFHFGKMTLSRPHAAQNTLGRTSNAVGSITLDNTTATDEARSLLSRTAPSSGSIAAAPALDLTNPQSIIAAPAPAAKAQASTVKIPSSDITGSIATSQPIVPPIPMPPHVTTSSTPSDGTLPAAIGSAALRKAATDGNAAATYEIAVRYAEGHGVTANLEQAAHWFEQAASKGLVPAQFRLASLYEKGRGVQKDLARARTLYLAAAEKGNAKAMHNLAVLYAEGVDDKPDYAMAARWFLKAANHGIADSQYNLAILYARGLGVEKSYSDSYKWFALAAKKGDHEAAKKRDEIATRLDAQTLAAVQQQVKVWRPEIEPHEATMVPQPAGGWDAQKAASPGLKETARVPG